MSTVEHSVTVTTYCTGTYFNCACYQPLTFTAVLADYSLKCVSLKCCISLAS